jgi:hypothetical protein
MIISNLFLICDNEICDEFIKNLLINSDIFNIYNPISHTNNNESSMVVISKFSK